MYMYFIIVSVDSVLFRLMVDFNLSVDLLFCLNSLYMYVLYEIISEVVIPKPVWAKHWVHYMY